MNKNDMPKKAKVEKDGKIKMESCKSIIEHEQDIIRDNIFHALKMGASETEINKYERDARKELEELKKQMMGNKDITLMLDWATERYIVAGKEAQANG